MKKHLENAHKLLSAMYAFVVVFIVKLVAYTYFLQESWNVMELQGIMRADRGGQVGMIMFVVVLVLGVWALSELLKKSEDTGDSVYFGFLVGVLVSLPEIANHFFYYFQWPVAVVGIVANVVAFTLAGYVYGISMKRHK